MRAGGREGGRPHNTDSKPLASTNYTIITFLRGEFGKGRQVLRHVAPSLSHLLDPGCMLLLSSRDNQLLYALLSQCQ